MFGPKPKANRSQAHREQAPHHVAFDAAEIKATGAGAWTGPRAAKHKRGGRKGRVWTYAELMTEGNDLIEWDGIDPKLIVDAEGRIVAVLLERPEDDDWDKIIEDMERILAGLRRRGIKARRGKFPTLYDGYSHGGGQRKPGNLRHSRGYRKLLRHLLQSKTGYVWRGFSGVANYFPKVLWRLRARAATAVQELDLLGGDMNLGPETVTAEHCDSHNRAHGVCPVTAMGDFDYKKGGHLYMRKLKCVIEFPPRSSAAILSGAFEHGNTPIQKGETRYSMTQYTAGALFRWAEYGFQTARSLLETEGGAEKKAQIDGVPGVRAAQAVGLLSKYDELEADRRMVFGG
ncbi:hypothetical protein B0H14DRAFT_2768112 [Mycena olivaceomarginata]|nr:hypothetical protein B0H14DRAFT_2768112 [Mycena olivaceomarginata]